MQRMDHEPRLLSYQTRSTNWLQRALLTVLGAGVAILAFFFLTVALIAGSILALAIAVRWWWYMRRVRAERRASAALEGEYTVIERAGEPEHRVRR